MTMAMAALLCLETAVSASQWPGSVRRLAASGRSLIGVLGYFRGVLVLGRASFTTLPAMTCLPTIFFAGLFLRSSLLMGLGLRLSTFAIAYCDKPVATPIAISSRSLFVR